MSLHGLSRNAWGRYTGGGTWDYRIIAPGFKYNMADPLAAIGVHQLAKAELFRRRRERIALQYLDEFSDLEALDLPPAGGDRIHAWHLFPIRLRPDRVSISREEFIEKLNHAGVSTSVHWRPLHLHPYYEETFGWRAHHCPVASRVWRSRVSLPLFPGMTPGEIRYVIDTVRNVCEAHRA
jgi:perosamine synthetase